MRLSLNNPFKRPGSLNFSVISRSIRPLREARDTFRKRFEIADHQSGELAHVSPPDRAELAEKIKKEVSDYLQAKVEELRPPGIEKISFVLAEGKGPEEIIDLSRRTSDNMVAMSTHGRSGIGRWVLGSVADRVISYCGDSVLVIRSVQSQA